MEQLFKTLIEAFALRLVAKYEKTWQGQILNMNNYWDDLVNCIDRNSFNLAFQELCRSYYCLPEDYDLSLAFNYTVTIWRIDLMLNVGKSLVRCFSDSTSDVVVWNICLCQLQIRYKIE